MHKAALVQQLFFSYLSAIIPPPREAVRPQIIIPAALRTEYYDLKAGQFLPKKRGRNEEIIIPPKFLNEPAINTFLQVGSAHTSLMFLTNPTIGLPQLDCLAASSAFFLASFLLVASSRNPPLSGSLTKSIEAKPKTIPSAPMNLYRYLHPY